MKKKCLEDNKFDVGNMVLTEEGDEQPDKNKEILLIAIQFSSLSLILTLYG